MVSAWQHQCLERPYRPERHQRQEALVLADDAFALLLLHGHVVAEQASAVSRIRPLLAQLPRRLVGHSLVGPDLAVRVWVAGTHHGAAVLEDEDMTYPVDGTELDVLVGPGLDHLADGVLLHLAQGEVVARGEADHPADASFALDHQQPVTALRSAGRLRHQGGKVVVEYVGGGVRGGARAACPFVARAQVASGVVLGAPLVGYILDLPLPGACGAVRRYQDPFTGQPVEPAVRRIEHVDPQVRCGVTHAEKGRASMPGATGRG